MSEPMRPAEYLVEAEWLLEGGMSCEYVCEVLGVSPSALTKTAIRFGNECVRQAAQSYESVQRYRRESA